MGVITVPVTGLLGVLQMLCLVLGTEPATSRVSNKWSCYCDYKQGLWCELRGSFLGSLLFCQEQETPTRLLWTHGQGLVLLHAL